MFILRKQLIKAIGSSALAATLACTMPASAQVLPPLPAGSTLPAPGQPANPNLNKHGAWRGNFAGPDRQGRDLAAMRQQLFDITNQTRIEHGAAPLVADAGMDDQAQIWAERVMAEIVRRKQYIMLHDVTGIETWNYVENCQIKWSRRYDIIAAAPLESTWGSDDPHWLYQIDPRMKRVGIGVAYDPVGQTYYIVWKFSQTLVQEPPRAVAKPQPTTVWTNDPTGTSIIDEHIEYWD